MRSEFGQEAMRELKAYRKSGKAADWNDVNRKVVTPGFKVFAIQGRRA